jgi:hypothetical protein
MATKRQELKKLMNERFQEALDTSAGASLDWLFPKQQDDAKYSEVIPDKDTDVNNVQFQQITAPTNNPSRPRALAAGYNAKTKTLYIAFRSGAWWQYENVSTDVWLGLTNSSSTNDYLPVLEAACSSHGPAQIRSMSAATLAQFSDVAQKAGNIQKGTD